MGGRTSGSKFVGLSRNHKPAMASLVRQKSEKFSALDGAYF
jgi:hypothetical protein